MQDIIKLTMLGGTRTGKTCYLVGMYGMMRRGEKGFTFAAVDLDEDLILAQQWKTIRTTTGDERWPKPTIETKDREFDFCYGYKPFRRFIWHDYRGGAMHSPLSDPDAQRLVRQLVDSSCIMLCFSAAHLSDPDGRVGRDGSVAIQVSEDGDDEATRMSRLLNEVAKQAAQRGQPLPSVVIVLTKYDLIANWPKDEVLKKVRELFRPLYTEGGGWTVTTCPVSLGKGLAGNEMEGRVDGINLHRPVAFAVYCAIRQSAAQVRAVREARSREVEMARNMGGLRRWWEGVNLTSREDALERTQVEVDELNKQLDVLFQELISGLRIFHNGEESEFND